jgi:hypothetical protein
MLTRCELCNSYRALQPVAFSSVTQYPGVFSEFIVAVLNLFRQISSLRLTSGVVSYSANDRKTLFCFVMISKAQTVK